MSEEKYKFPLRRAAMKALSNGAAEEIISALVEKATAGDIKSAEFIRDLAGEKAGSPETTLQEPAALSWDEKIEIINRLRSMPSLPAEQTAPQSPTLADK